MIEPKHAKLMEFMKAAMESPEPESEVVGPDGTGLRIIKHPEPGVRVRMEPIGDQGAGLRITIWEPSQERPQGYPDEMPFVPNATASVTVIADKGSVAVNWWDVENATTMIDQLASESAAAGWERSDGAPAPEMVPVQMVILRRGTRTRLIMAAPMSGGGMVSLVEQQSGQDAEAV